MESAIKKLRDGLVIYLTPKEKKWLIEQAEKVEQLEKDIKFHEAITAKYIALKEKSYSDGTDYKR
jgi:hypothetical protein